MTMQTAEELFYRALSLQQQNLLSEAEALYRDALQLAPNRSSILINLATTLAGLGKIAEAQALCERSLNLDPDEMDALLILGTCQSNMGQKTDALATFERALALNPGSVDAWNGRGNVLVDLGKPLAALESYDKAIVLAPDRAELLNNRGSVLQDLERHEDALASFDQALRLHPDFATAFNNRGSTLLSMGQTRAALKNFCEASRLKPDYARARWNEGLCRLSLCDFAAGWKLYEWGWQDGKRGAKLESSSRWWAGNSVNGRLLAWSEQGIGDQILFSSMLPELTRYSKQVFAAVDKRLVPLFGRSFPDIKVVAKDNADLSKEPFEDQIALGSMGQHLRNSLSDFPNNRIAYLTADSIRARALRSRLTLRKFVCGISWLSKNNIHANRKSIKLEDLLPIISMRNLQIVDLQYGDTAGERQDLHNISGFEIVHFDEMDNTNDIDGLASLICACDMVVTISNTTAHLAGALGIPVTLLLPYGTGRHWYWHEGQKHNPWYPTVRIFEQDSAGHWPSAITKAKAFLYECSCKR